MGENHFSIRKTYVVLGGAMAIADKKLTMVHVAGQDLFDSVQGWESGWSVCGSALCCAGTRPG